MIYGDKLCLGCTGWLRFTDVLGWVHVDGAGPIWQRCPSCGWSGSEASALASTASVCPACHDLGLRDHHRALPDRRVA